MSDALSILEDTSTKKPRCNESHINKIPLELLSRVFIVGDDEQRGKRGERAPYSGFQDLVVQVCNHWRNVAINNPALWTYIYISGPPPHEHTSLYLARAGSSTLLDIDLDINLGEPDFQTHIAEWPGYVRRTNDTLAFLRSHGASIGRWKSFMVRSKMPQVLFKAIGFVNSEPAPALRFVSLHWTGGFDVMGVDVESESYPLDESHTISSSRLPQLRSANLITLPAFFLLRRPLPIVTGLTHLKLSAAHDPLSPTELHVLLSSNLQLESLCLGMGYAFRGIGSTDRRVSMPSLCSLSLISIGSWSWAMNILRMIDAPTVKHLQLSATYNALNEDAFPQIVTYLTTGKYQPSDTDVSRNSGDARALADKTIYPALEHLDIHGLWIVSSIPQATNELRRLFSALDTVNCLATPTTGLEVLANAPWVLPNLHFLRIIARPPVGLGNDLRRRAEAGFPIKTLEIRQEHLRDIEGGLPDSVAVVEPPSYVYEDEDDTDEDELDDDDDEDNDYYDLYHDDYDEYDDEWPDEAEYQLGGGFGTHFVEELMYDDDDDEEEEAEDGESGNEGGYSDA